MSGRLLCVVVLSILLSACSSSDNADSSSAKDAKVCQSVMAGGIPNRVAWGAEADPSTEIGKAAIAASHPKTASGAYQLDAALTKLCAAAGY